MASSMRTGLKDAPSDGGDLETRTSSVLLAAAKTKSLEAALPGAEKTDVAPKPGKKALKRMKRAERDKTKGDAWFGMRAPEVTDETKRDLEVLQMRGALDPKRFYKKNDRKELPKFFQIGQVIDSPAEFYSDRMGQKQRKKTLVDELMADAEFKRYSKRRYAAIISEESKRGGGARQPERGGKRKRKADAQ